jgi:hypothetical protein
VLIAVSGNNVHVAWFNVTPGNTKILYSRSTDGGANFEPTVNLSNNAQNSNFPSIAVHDNTAHIVWTHDIANGDEIFYIWS